MTSGCIENIGLFEGSDYWVLSMFEGRVIDSQTQVPRSGLCQLWTRQGNGGREEKMSGRKDSDVEMYLWSKEWDNIQKHCETSLITFNCPHATACVRALSVPRPSLVFCHPLYCVLCMKIVFINNAGEGLNI